MKRFGIILMTVLILAGCGETALHHNLLELEADEILVVLHQNGIEAKKEKEVSGQEVSWKVEVKGSQLAHARQILLSNNLPRKRELGLSGVYKEKGLIPTPDEQKARFLLALKGEIINSLQTIPGVVNADIVLNVPDENEFAGFDAVKKKTTASVVVKTRNEEVVAQTVTEGKIQRFVANAVPNLDPNDVTVIVTRADTGAPMMLASTFTTPTNSMSGGEGIPPSGSLPDQAMMSGAEGEVVHVGGIAMQAKSVGRFKLYFVTLLLLLVGVSGFLLFNIMRFNRLRHRVQRGRGRTSLGGPAGGSTGLLSEGEQSPEGLVDVGAEQGQHQL